MEHATAYEDYVQSYVKASHLPIQNLGSNYSFSTGVDHMNQVMSYARLIYFGYIIEETGVLQKNLTTSPSSKKNKPALAFGERVIGHKEIQKLKDDSI